MHGNGRESGRPIWALLTADVRSAYRNHISGPAVAAVGQGLAETEALASDILSVALLLWCSIWCLKEPAAGAVQEPCHAW